MHAKRQAAADKVHADNQMKQLAAGKATLTADGIVSNQKSSGQSVEEIMHAKRQAAADDIAKQNKLIWKYGSEGQKSKGTQHYSKYAHKEKFGGVRY